MMDLFKTTRLELGGYVSCEWRNESGMYYVRVRMSQFVHFAGQGSTEAKALDDVSKQVKAWREKKGG